MGDDTKNFKVTTWEKALLLRKRKGWAIADMVSFLNTKRVVSKVISERSYKGWESGSAVPPRETEERIDDIITIELYRTQKPMS